MTPAGARRAWSRRADPLAPRAQALRERSPAAAASSGSAYPPSDDPMSFKVRTEVSMTRSILVLLPRLALLGAACFGCSAPSPGGAPATVGPSVDTEATPFDPLNPGASIICDRTSPTGETSAFAYVISALNFKLSQYPDFA